MASQPKTCAQCSAPLCRRNSSGYCQLHSNQRPEKRAKVSAGLRRAHLIRPELREVRRRAAVKNARDPEINARRSAAAKRDKVWEKGVAARTPETYARIAATQRHDAIAWCPPHLRDHYRHLVHSQRYLAADARRMILEQHEAEMRRWRRKVLGEQPPAPIVHEPDATFAERATAVAAHWAGVADLWCRGGEKRVQWARWAVWLALSRGGLSQSAIAAATGMDRRSVAYALPRAEVLAADIGSPLREVLRLVVSA